MENICGMHCKEYINDIKLKLLWNGVAEVDDNWKGSVVNSVCSRLYYVTDGEFYVMANGEKIYLKSGAWHLIPCGYSYEFGTKVQMKHLFFHLNLLCENGNDFFNKELNIMSLTNSKYNENDIIPLIKSNKTIDKLKLKNLIMEILLDFATENDVSLDKKEYSPCIKKATEYIKNNLSATLTIKEIAKNIYVSESTLTKHFKKELSTTVNNYVNDLTLFYAAQVLVSTNKTISQISESFGYCDRFYFSRKFKEKFGKSPAEYKKSWNV